MGIDKQCDYCGEYFECSESYIEDLKIADAKAFCPKCCKDSAEWCRRNNYGR